MSIQGNENLFFTCHLKAVLDDSVCLLKTNSLFGRPQCFYHLHFFIHLVLLLNRIAYLSKWDLPMHFYPKFLYFLT